MAPFSPQVKGSTKLKNILKEIKYFQFNIVKDVDTFKNNWMFAMITFHYLIFLSLLQGSLQEKVQFNALKILIYILKVKIDLKNLSKSRGDFGLTL